jgi:hypothetical protein
MKRGFPMYDVLACKLIEWKRDERCEEPIDSTDSHEAVEEESANKNFNWGIHHAESICEQVRRTNSRTLDESKR